MISRLSRLWREPLLHFLLIGFALFVFYEQVADNAEAPPKQINVAAGQVEQLAANFQRTWSRPPTPRELEQMIEGYVREEVFYREALAMGLDRGDPLVRRRLRMKLEFMLEDLASQAVDDPVLETYLQQNIENFRVEAQVSFTHVYLNPERRKDINADAMQLLQRLRGGADPDSLGDATLAPRNYQRARQSEIARDFGEEFSVGLAKLPRGEWSGPVWSPFGAHLVRIDERVDARNPALAEVRDQVLREYHAEQRKLQKDLAYQQLRETYEVTIETPADSSGADVISEANAGSTK